MARGAEINARAHTTGKGVQVGLGLGSSDPKALEDNQEAC